MFGQSWKTKENVNGPRARRAPPAPLPRPPFGSHPLIPPTPSLPLPPPLLAPSRPFSPLLVPSRPFSSLLVSSLSTKGDGSVFLGGGAQRAARGYGHHGGAAAVYGARRDCGRTLAVVGHQVGVSEG